ncbi:MULTISPECIES: M28 family peptidase [unclassified Pseudoalteromonas]|uniref:M28 family peptidase n=1 Tax=Pseudoalteromonas sp. SD03 TaxID=3231719 RepID=A0AB39AUL2_9GAMM|nr:MULTISPECIES: M28 family peptidase [unclassified Pseudoalteromonas]MDN3400823.1 M28 family peptidase [Pseudoalteromonas sp. APC 3213]MDN3472382.1 M28 family peptidase [Pseudoalteromonas sp. APC 4026]
MEQPFTYPSGLFSKAQGVNIVATKTEKNLPVIVITAHYDHLGLKAGKLHPGANDNASGVAALLYLSNALKVQSSYGFVFVATDAEENGLHGSEHFAKTMRQFPVALNINLDMLAIKKSHKRLYALTSRSLKNQLTPLFSQIKNTSVELKPVYSSRKMSRLTNTKQIDWHRASDHYSFAKQKIPYVYFSMGADNYHHTAKDTLENINTALYQEAVLLIEAFINQLLTKPEVFSPPLKAAT